MYLCSERDFLSQIKSNLVQADIAGCTNLKIAWGKVAPLSAFTYLLATSNAVCCSPWVILRLWNA